MNAVATLQLAGAFEDIGDHLLGIGDGWGEKALKVLLVFLVVVKIAQKFSIKAGIGALIGLVICLGIYDSREDLAGAFRTELNSAPAPASREMSLPPGGGAE